MYGLAWKSRTAALVSWAYNCGQFGQKAAMNLSSHIADGSLVTTDDTSAYMTGFSRRKDASTRLVSTAPTMKQM